MELMVLEFISLILIPSNPKYELVKMEGSQHELRRRRRLSRLPLSFVKFNERRDYHQYQFYFLLKNQQIFY